MTTEATRCVGTFEASSPDSGWLRRAELNYAARPDDVRLSRDVIKALGLRGGEALEGICRAGRKGPQRELREVEKVNGRPPEDFAALRPFEELTAIDPDRQIRFESPGGPPTMRVVDLMTPIGIGQRGLIVAPPRTGKTILLQQMAAGVAANYPDLYMMVLLIDERPEEVTEMRRTVHGEVVSSSNDHDVASHIRIARLMLQKAKRMVECGENVFILLDSLTRLGRAFNAGGRGHTGRIMSGGIDGGALIEPKGIFGAARNVEHGGSLTIIASILVDTGSRMDEVIFNEFKGTGNMEIMLSRELANRRLWPAIDLQASGTRKEERLLDARTLEQVVRIRRTLLGRPPVQQMEALLAELQKHPDNASMIARLGKA
jgi:transcription termination factor Rho